MYINEGLKKYIEDLAARLPAPGGGSAAALSGAIGTALLEMVCNFTIGNEKYKAAEEEIKAGLDSLRKIREGFMVLVDKDVEAYLAIRAAFKTKDKKVIDKALKDGYYISLNICDLSKKAMQAAVSLPEKGNANLITDVGCGAELLSAAFNSGVFNLEVNLKGIGDKDFVSKEKSALGDLKKEMERLYRDAIKKAKKRME